MTYITYDVLISLDYIAHLVELVTQRSWFEFSLNVATVVRYVTSSLDTSGFVQHHVMSPRESHMQTGRVLVLLVFCNISNKQFLNLPLHILCAFFDIIKGSAYGSYIEARFFFRLTSLLLINEL